MSKVSNKLKIILGDSSSLTEIWVGDKKLGLIQNVKIIMDIQMSCPVVQITTLNPYTMVEGDLKKIALETVNLLKTVPNTTIFLLDFCEKKFEVLNAK